MNQKQQVFRRVTRKQLHPPALFDLLCPSSRSNTSCFGSNNKDRIQTSSMLSQFIRT
ncbi:hypothetical protein CLOSTMETH_01129 [[Clostridium] methylpentosum DSM 5476]|uniref:Uncharacterized protein n=1 Tax=[Clostridium] methylpentosum DSM 5476 TaxID=537013 RepID=C0EBB1_9FIRM|nr:hypothetical protein CLOSTMETH_01129 [[Clostridium] methylpentosum DSM 5476]